MGQAFSATCGSGTRQYFHAASSGEISSLKEVLLTRPDLLQATTSGGQNVVHLAAGKGDKEVLKAVVDIFSGITDDLSSHSSDEDLKVQAMRNMDSSRQLRTAFNSQTHAGQTPLMLAARNGHTSCVRFLVDKGADVFKTDKSHQRSVLHYAVFHGQDRVVRYLVSENTQMHSDEGVQPLRSIQVNDISGQCRFIDSRAENGLTALHIAAVRGDLKIVKYLLDAGASMMVRTVDMDMPSPHSVPNGSTPLHLAAQKGSVAIVQAMLQAHADALGNWSDNNNAEGNGRRGWEQSTRIDLRSVANALRQLPYHVAWQRGFRQTAQILNPTIAIDIALENVRELDEGVGPQKLSTLAAYSLRKNLLEWLAAFKLQLEQDKINKERRAKEKKVIAQQKRKEALKFHSQESVDASIAEINSKMVSRGDTGHTFSLSSNSDRSSQDQPSQPLRGHTRAKSKQDRQDVLSTIHSNANFQGSEELSLGSSLGSLGVSEVIPSQNRRATDIPEATGGSSQASQSTKESERSTKESQKSSLTAASMFRRSFKKLRPSRPPPPPPETATQASQASQASASSAVDVGRRHRRTVSWEETPVVVNTRADLSSSPPAVAGCLGSPFRSPFAQAVTDLAPEDEMEEPGSRPSLLMASHPSGVALQDPPEILSPTLARALSSKSKKGSFSVASFTSRPSLRTKKSRRLSQEFGRALSIPGFDNNLDADEDCGICMEETVNVAVAECKHKLCVDCAIKLCQVAKKPPLCPFCRITINAFAPCED